MQIQTILNSDIVMQFDECTPYDTQGHVTTEAEARKSMELSLRWAGAARPNSRGWRTRNALFGIVQGGMFENLREESLAQLVEMDFPGYAIGGVSVGEPKDEMLRIMAHTPHKLPAEQAALPDGRGHARGPGRRRGAGRRHVRLRDAHPQRAQRHAVLALRRPEDAQRAPQERPAADRPELHLPRLCRCLGRAMERRRARRLQPRLPASPRPLRRNAGADAHHDPQPALLPEPDARDPRGARRRASSRSFARASRRTARAASEPVASDARRPAASSTPSAFRPARAPRRPLRPVRGGPTG